MATAAELAGYLSNPNVQKFLRVVGQAEGTVGDKIADPYRVGFGGATLESLDSHPNVLVPFTQTDGTKNKTSAAGAYQFIKPTWDEEANELGLTDFSPRSQDLAAINRLRKRGALDDVLNGRMDAAVAKLGNEWASLPSSPYAQPKRSAGFIEQALNAVIPSAEAAQVPNIDLSQVKWDAPASGDIDLSGVKWDPTPTTDKSYRVDMNQQDAQRMQAAAPTAASQAQKIQASALGRAAQGAVVDPLNAGAQLLANSAPSGVVNAVNSATQYVNDLPVIGPITKFLGMTPATPDQLNQSIAAQEQQYQDARKATGQQGFDAARLAGNVIGTAPLAAAMAPVAGLSVPASIAAAAGSGAVLGGLQPVTEKGDFTENKLKQMAFGGVAAGALSGAGNALARLISPRASVNPNVQRLMDEGVTPTPGQLLGGTAQRLEDKAMSIPVFGDAIGAARGRGVEDLNRAALNRVVEPLGQEVNAIGREGMQQAQRIVSNAYDDVIPRLHFRADNQFAQELGQLQQMARSMPPAQAQQFEQIVRTQVGSRMTAQGGATGQNFREIQEQIGKLAQDYIHSPDPGYRQLGTALSELGNSLRSAMERANPEVAAELAKANQAYAMLTRLQRAAGSQGAAAAEGVFTPAQLSSAVRAGDRTMRKNAFARGEALMQDLSDAGVSVLGTKVPNSGSADRAMLGALGTGLYNPLITLSLGGASIPYLPGANRLAAALIARRPEIAPQLAQSIAGVLPAAGVIAAPAANQILQK